MHLQIGKEYDIPVIEDAVKQWSYYRGRMVRWVPSAPFPSRLKDHDNWRRRNVYYK